MHKKPNPNHAVSGVFVAAITPLTPDDRPDLDSIPSLLQFYAQRGCHGALLLGTTGEGPSFSPEERREIFSAAGKIRETDPDFKLLAGTGTPSLTETISISRQALETGFDGVVVLPPYYFRDVADEGLFAWFSKVIEQAVPDGKLLFGYHFPKVSGVALSIDLLDRLKSKYPVKFAGIKDSSGDPEHARRLGASFGADLAVFTGNDRLFNLALANQGAGSITAAANLFSPELRRIWDGWQAEVSNPTATDRLIRGRAILDNYQPSAPALKALLSNLHGFPNWPVRAPLLALDSRKIDQAIQELEGAGLVGSQVG